VVWRARVLTAAFALGAGAAFAGGLPYTQDFSGTNGSPWPAPWVAATNLVTTSDLQGGRGRLNGVPGNVARMLLPGFSAVDVEVEVTFEFANAVGQGIGFYVRQNGGSLREYVPHGEGYAMFLKGPWAWPEDLGIWREIDGIETQFATGYNPIPATLENGVRYRLRFRVAQSAPDATRLQARVWPESESEPTAWTVDVTDTEPLLQGTAGSFAIDIYNHFGTSPVFLDDLVIRNWPDLTAVGDRNPDASLAIAGLHPHPVAGSTRIELAAPREAHAELRLFDSAGRFVSRLFSGPITPGAFTIEWPGRDAQGRRLRPGVYFLSLVSGAERASRRIVVIE
jgi:hypothetical protein